MSDIGLTHIALPVTNMEESLAFYATYAHMQVVHRRTDPDGTEVVWLSDRTRPFVIVLIQSPRVDAPLLPLAHLGVGCATRQEVDALCEHARQAAVCARGRQIQAIRSAIGPFWPTRTGTPLKSPMDKKLPSPSPRSQRETIRPDAPYRVSASYANHTGLGITTWLHPAAQNRPRLACA